MLISPTSSSDLQTNIEAAPMQVDSSKHAKLFFMMSAGLYSNKALSIVRELCSNAYDAHKAAKQKEPFKLIPPSFEDATLRIIDKGPGLTYEEAKKTILCFLGSTKDSSDEAIGGWGIGSKSPFSYTNQYSITTRKDGRYWNISCWKNESGMPQEALMDEGETDEPNGVTFEVPVQELDINKWRSVIQTYMDFTNYEIDCPIKSRFTERKLIESADVYDIMEYRGHTSEDRIILLYGGQFYRVGRFVNMKSNIFFENSVNQFDQIARLVSDNRTLVINVHTPNAVLCAMSREELDDHPRTVGLVTAAVSRIYEALAAVNKLKNVFTGYSATMSSLAAVGEVEWEGTKLHITNSTSVSGSFKEALYKFAKVDEKVKEVTGKFGHFASLAGIGERRMQVLVDHYDVRFGRWAGQTRRVSDLKGYIGKDPMSIFTFFWMPKKPATNAALKASFDAWFENLPVSHPMHNMDEADARLQAVFIEAENEDAAKAAFLRLPAFIGYACPPLEHLQVRKVYRNKAKRQQFSKDTSAYDHLTERRITFAEKETYVMVDKSKAGNALNAIIRAMEDMNVPDLPARCIQIAETVYARYVKSGFPKPAMTEKDFFELFHDKLEQVLGWAEAAETVQARVSADLKQVDRLCLYGAAEKESALLNAGLLRQQNSAETAVKTAKALRAYPELSLKINPLAVKLQAKKFIKAEAAQAKADKVKLDRFVKLSKKARFFNMEFLNNNLHMAEVRDFVLKNKLEDLTSFEVVKVMEAMAHDTDKQKAETDKAFREGVLANLDREHREKQAEEAEKAAKEEPAPVPESELMF